MIVALIPAHNEEEVIESSVRSLLPQVDKVIVVADNCTDNTIVVAQEAGADIFVTEGNTAKKAGALNQAIATVINEYEFILVVDADSVLSPYFIHNAMIDMNFYGLAAVGGIFEGQPGGGLVGFLQRQEFARYKRDVARLGGKSLCLTGTATLIRSVAFKTVARFRGKILPGTPGQYYDTAALTEDFEFSLALKHLGLDYLSPRYCTLTTEVMPTWRELWHQRLRWKRGAVENLKAYGLTRVTAKHWFLQIVTMLGIIVSAAYLGTLLYALITWTLVLKPFWIIVTILFALERMITVRSRGFRATIIAGLLVVEMVFDFFLQFVHIVAYKQALTHAERKW